MLKEFLDFLKEYKIVGLAIAFVIGTASTALINSLVKDIIMPILSPILSAGAWKDAMLDLGPVHIAYGSFVAELLNFIILAAIVFFVTKKILKLQNEQK